MTEAMMLLERAARCREIAKDYHPTVGEPLYELARDLEAQAERIRIHFVGRPLISAH